MSGYFFSDGSFSVVFFFFFFFFLYFKLFYFDFQWVHAQIQNWSLKRCFVEEMVCSTVMTKSAD